MFLDDFKMVHAMCHMMRKDHYHH